MSVGVIVINRGRSSCKWWFVCDYFGPTGSDELGVAAYPASVTFEIKMAACDMQSLTLRHQTPAAIFLRR